MKEKIAVRKDILVFNIFETTHSVEGVAVNNP